MKPKQRTYNDALQEQLNARRRHLKALDRRSELKLIDGGGEPEAPRTVVTVHPGAERTLQDIIDREERNRIRSKVIEKESD